MRAAAAKWSGVGLNQLGRVLVAKQCLASKAVYQFGFVEPSAQQLADMQAAIRTFVAQPSGHGELSVCRHRLFPREAVMALPREAGGLGYPILANAATAMRAKLVARAFGPGLQQWKPLVRASMAAAASPTITIDTWPITMGQAHDDAAQLCSRLPPYLRPHVLAFLQLRPTRRVDEASQGFHSVMAEPLYFNPSVCSGGSPLQPGALGLGAEGWRCLGDVRRAVQRGAPASAAAADLVMGAVPPAWRAHLQRDAEPEADWACTTWGGVTYAFEGQRPGPEAQPAAWAAKLYWQLPTGRLALTVPPKALEAEATAQLAAARLATLSQALSSQPWVPAAVFPLPKPRGRWSEEDYALLEEYQAARAAQGQQGGGGVQLDVGPPPDSPIEFWLQGPWASVCLDPSAWGVAGASLLEYSVKAATKAIAASKAQPALGPEFDEGCNGRWPPLWQGPHTAGLAGVETKWLQSFSTRQARPVSQHASAATPGEAERQAMTDSYHDRGAPWLRLGPSNAEPSARLLRRQAREAPPMPPVLPPLEGATQRDGVPLGAGPDLWQAQQRDTPQEHQSRDGVSQRDGAPLGAGPGLRQAQQQPGVVPPPALPARSPQATAAAWRRLHGDRGTCREFRLVCFRVMHAVLPVNACRAHILNHLPRPAFYCPNPACSAACFPETLTHAFLECPAAAPVVDWALAWWAHLTPGSPQPPRSSQLLLADDREGAGWQPPAGTGRVWNTLRTCLLGCMWDARCSLLAWHGDADPLQERLYATSLALQRSIRDTIELQWLRVTTDIPHLSDQYPSNWFKGRPLSLQQKAFLRDWGMGGALCSCRPDQPPSLQIHLTPGAPVPIPGLAPRGDDNAQGGEGRAEGEEAGQEAGGALGGMAA